MKPNTVGEMILNLTEENIRLKHELNEKTPEKVGTQTKATTRYWECQYERLACFVTLMDCARNNVNDATAEEKLESIDSCLLSCVEIIDCVKKGIEWKGSKTKGVLKWNTNS